MIPCLSVLTARGVDRILREGGSQAWRLKPENAERARYCVCVQNRKNGLWGGADQPHHQAFMVGRIREIVPSPEGRSGRYLVVFSEYALIESPNAWPSLRNPVRYASLEEFGVRDPDNLDWIPMPSVREGAADVMGEDEEANGFGPLTIPEAKSGLSLGLGIPEAAIEITIRY